MDNGGNERRMTDGIIQEVFKKFHTTGGYGFEVEIDENTVNVVPVALVEEAFKELIEKIKQANTKNPDWDSNFAIGVKLMKIYLIGDNQE